MSPKPLSTGGLLRQLRGGHGDGNTPNCPPTPRPPRHPPRQSPSSLPSVKLPIPPACTRICAKRACQASASGHQACIGGRMECALASAPSLSIRPLRPTISPTPLPIRQTPALATHTRFANSLVSCLFILGRGPRSRFATPQTLSHQPHRTQLSHPTPHTQPLTPKPSHQPSPSPPPPRPPSTSRRCSVH